MERELSAKQEEVKVESILEQLEFSFLGCIWTVDEVSSEPSIRPAALQLTDSDVLAADQQYYMPESHSSVSWFETHPSEQDVWGRRRDSDLSITRSLLTHQQGSGKEWEAFHFFCSFKVPESGIPFFQAAVCGLIIDPGFLEGGIFSCSILLRRHKLELARFVWKLLELSKKKGAAGSWLVSLRRSDWLLFSVMDISVNPKQALPENTISAQSVREWEKIFCSLHVCMSLPFSAHIEHMCRGQHTSALCAHTRQTL